ncbi:MAG: nucleotidyltransferase domain-containing protein [Alphaproteobacteria bacterium]|jgi:predicted nucleotidyltransferase|nr:nucleotidyltransferase domain-containing protein [Alphaproteobacteria bacterium]
MALAERARNAGHRARALETIRSIVFAELAGRRARVFLIGSCARGDWCQGSDIDIAIELRDEPDLYLIPAIRAALEDSDVPYFVDVVDLGSADAELVTTIRREGVEWTDPNAA